MAHALRRVAPPGRLRRRLAVSFVLVAGVSTALLAVATFLLVRQSRLDDSVERALRIARLNLQFAQQNLTDHPGPAQTEALLAFYSTGGFGTVIFTGDRVNASSVPLRAFRPPDDLRALIADGQVGYERLDVGGDPSLVVGERVRPTRTDLYFVFSEASLQADLRQLAVVLGIGWLVVLAVSAIAGVVLARRALEPVARASDAARAMAEGLLDTRIPVETDDEFGDWAASFNEMAGALEAKIAALSEARERERRFTSDVSHELRTPLTALVSEASLLRDHLDAIPLEARRPAELLIADVARLRRLVEELMEISRLDAEAQPATFEPVDLEALVRAVVAARDWNEVVGVVGSGGVVGSEVGPLVGSVGAGVMGSVVGPGGLPTRVIGVNGTDATGPPLFAPSAQAASRAAAAMTVMRRFMSVPSLRGSSASHPRDGGKRGPRRTVTIPQRGAGR